MKKNIFISLLGFAFLIFLINCKSSNVTNKQPFKIIEKTYYNWAGGQPGVKGTNVVLKLIKVGEEFKADSLYFTYKGTKLETHIKKDTLVLMAYFSTPRVPLKLEVEPSQKNIQENLSLKIPYTLKPNEAVLIYYIKGVKGVLRISNLSETSKKYYP